MISMDEVKVILGPHETQLYCVVTSSWERYHNVFAPMLAMPYKRGRATIMYELMADEARRRFEGAPGVRVIEEEQRLLLDIDPLLIRFKKLDFQFRTHNYPTQLSLSFDLQLPLPGIPSRERVTIGYCLNTTATEIAVKVVYLLGAQVQWQYTLGQQGAEIVPIGRSGLINEGGEAEEGRLARPRLWSGREDEPSS